MTDYGSFRWCFLVNMALGFNLSPVESIVGHDPQKLLPDHRGTTEHFAYAYRQINVTRWNEADSTPLEDIKRWMDALYTPRDYTNAMIAAFVDTDLDKEFIDFANLGTGRHVDFRKLYPEREHKMAVLSIHEVDYASIEKRILAQIDDPRVRVIMLDMDSGGGEIYNPGFSLAAPDFDFTDKPVATRGGKRDMGYLKHDPTKRHKRGKRK